MAPRNKKKAGVKRGPVEKKTSGAENTAANGETHNPENQPTKKSDATAKIELQDTNEQSAGEISGDECAADEKRPANAKRKEVGLGGNPSKNTAKAEDASENAEQADAMDEANGAAEKAVRKPRTACKRTAIMGKPVENDADSVKGNVERRRAPKRMATNPVSYADVDSEEEQHDGKKKVTAAAKKKQATATNKKQAAAANKKQVAADTSKKPAAADSKKQAAAVSPKQNDDGKRRVAKKKVSEVDEQLSDAEEKQKEGSRKRRAVEMKEKEQVQVDAAKSAKKEPNPNGATTKILTWNVAGVRAWIKKNGHNILTKESPDIIALQETKCTEIPKELEDGYYTYLDPAEKAGHGGVILMTKKEPIKVSYGFPAKDLADVRGRVIVAEYDNCYVINAYVPNSGRGLVNLEMRKVWEDAYLEYIKSLNEQKPVVYVGDLNVAHEEIDLANPKTNRNKTAGFTDQERADFTRLLDAGFVDVYRKLNPEKEGAYTFWSNMHNAREKNVGWRLDYFVVSERLMEKVKGCSILADVKGSDHCPLTLDIEL